MHALRRSTLYNMPHISVTIPAFRHADLIGHAIETVLAQDMEDFDVLVVDDGSPDESFEVASASTPDPRIRCERNEQNLGLAGNWNRCLTTQRRSNKC